MRVVDDHVHGVLRFDRRHEGAPGFVHGGAIATALDDLLGTVLLIVERPAVTATLTVDFRAPVLLERDVHMQAWCDATDGRKIHLRGEARDARQLVAEARAIFVEVDLSHFECSGEPLPDAWSRWGQRPAPQHVRPLLRTRRDMRATPIRRRASHPTRPVTGFPQTRLVEVHRGWASTNVCGGRVVAPGIRFR